VNHVIVARPPGRPVIISGTLVRLVSIYRLAENSAERSLYEPVKALSISLIAYCPISEDHDLVLTPIGLALTHVAALTFENEVKLTL
jgi:hypothetical protein